LRDSLRGGWCTLSGVAWWSGAVVEVEADEGPAVGAPNEKDAEGAMVRVQAAVHGSSSSQARLGGG